MARTSNTRTWTGRAAAGAAVLAGAALALLAHRGVACEDTGDQDSIPYQVDFGGIVHSAVGRTVVVGTTTVVVPQPGTLRYANGARLERGYWIWDDVKVGDRVSVEGSLRPDGTVCPYFLMIETMPELELDEFVAGVCEVVGDGTCTVGGRTITIVPQEPSPDWVYADGGTQFEIERGWSDSPAYRPIHVGDVVGAVVKTAGDGRLIATEAMLRQSGEGTVLAGTIRGWDDDREMLDIDGVRVRVDEYSCPNAGYDRQFREDRWVDVAAPSAIGQWVRVRGVLRNGIVLANEVRFSVDPATLGDGGAAKRAESLPRRRGWMRMRGMVTESSAGHLGVNDFGVRTGRRVRGVAVGLRVRVNARLLADGPVATSIVRR